MRSLLPKVAHLLSYPALFIPLHFALITALNRTLSLPSPYHTLLNSSLNQNSDLHVRSEYGIINLDANSCQMTAVDTLAFLATYDYDESIPGVEGQARDPSWGGTYILINPAPYARDIKIQYAVEGLYTVMYDMTVVRQQFNNGKFQLLLGNVVIGTINFLPWPKGGNQSTRILAGLSESFRNTPSMPTTTATTSSENLTYEWGVEYRSIPGGSALTTYQFFITVLITLGTVAQFPVRDIVAPFESSASGVDCRMEIRGQRRSSWPFPEYLWVIEVVRLAPEWMLLNRISAEIEFYLDVDRIEVVRGSMRKGGLPERVVGLDRTSS